MAFFYQSDSSISFEFTQLEARVKSKSTQTSNSIAKLFHTSLVKHLFFFVLTSVTLMTLLLSKSNILFAASIGLFFLSFFSWICFRSYEKTKMQGDLKLELDLFMQSANTLLPLDIDCITKQSSLMQSLSLLQENLFDPNYFKLKLHPFTFENKTIRSIAFFLHSPHLKHFIFYIIEKIHLHNCILIEQMPTSSLAHKNFAKALLKLLDQLRVKKHLHHSGPVKLASLFTDPQVIRKKERLLTVAVKELELANSFCQNDQWTLKTLAYCFKLLEKKDKELAIMQNLYELYPSEKNILYQLATLYFDLGKTDKALSVYCCSLDNLF